MVDEVLNITNREKRRNLLNLCTSFQQAQLLQKFPTFFVVTSLNYFPINQEVKSNSGRPLRLVALPVLSDQSLEEQETNITNALLSVMTSDDPQKSLHSYVRSLVSIVVWISGKHFRTLETMLKTLYSHIVSKTSHQRALKNGLLWVKAMDPPKQDEELSLKFLKDSIHPEFFSSLLSSGCSEILESIEADRYFSLAFRLFLSLVIKPETYIPEQEVIELESTGACFIKSRERYNFSSVIPRVNLPFLYSYCRIHYPIPETKRERVIDDHIGHLFVRIIEAVNSFAAYKHKPPSITFEEVMLWIELVRIYALVTSWNKRDVVVSLWKSSSLWLVWFLALFILTMLWKTTVLEVLLQIWAVVFLMLVYYVLKSLVKKWLQDNAVNSVNNSSTLNGLASLVLSTDAYIDRLFVYIKVYFLLPYRPIEISEILPGVIIEKWESSKIDRLIVAPCLLSKPFQLEKEIPNNGSSPLDNTLKAIEMALDVSNANIVQIKQNGNNVTQGIEYVVKHFVHESSDSEPVLFLTSMKLRDQKSREMKNIVSLAQQLHDVAKQAKLKDRQYYVVFYCSIKEKSLRGIQLPPGTIVVPNETILSLLRPFGVSFLANTIEEKIQ